MAVVNEGKTHVDATVTYFQGNLKKKEGKSIWKDYHVVLTLGRLSFYDAEDETKFVGKISLSPGARCVLAKRRTYSFRFRLLTQRGAFMFKCENYLERWQWIHTISLSAAGKEPGEIPQYVPRECRSSNNNESDDALPLTTFGFDADENEPNPLTFKRSGSLRQSMRRLAGRMSLRKRKRGGDDTEYKSLQNATSTVTLQDELDADAMKNDIQPPEEKVARL